jgi:hypothetical protein
MASQPSVELITPEESIERTVPREAPAHIKTRLSTIIYIYIYSTVRWLLNGKNRS